MPYTLTGSFGITRNATRAKALFSITHIYVGLKAHSPGFRFAYAGLKPLHYESGASTGPLSRISLRLCRAKATALRGRGFHPLLAGALIQQGLCFFIGHLLDLLQQSLLYDYAKISNVG